jgi:flagellar hook assembly protein FlgD
MPVGTRGCRIYDSSGSLVAKLKENSFFRFEWDGKNRAGNYCASGVYFFVIATEDKEVGRGKIMLIRKD